MGEIILIGNVKEGLGIASGNKYSPDIPETEFSGTIDLQRLFFEEAGLEKMQDMYGGTINVDISPNKFKILNPDHMITCEWASGVEETFHFVKTLIHHNKVRYEGYIYYPCPSEFKSHNDNIVELLTYKIPDLGYGDKISIEVSENKIKLI